MNIRFLISEVAQRYNISRPALIYYDKIGLLKPSHDESNGYRYYSYGDMEKLELILTLKESGLSLKAIKSFMDEPSHQSGVELLGEQKDKIVKKIGELTKLQSILEKRISTIEEYERVELYEGIRVDHYPAMSICKSDLDYDEAMPLEKAVKRLKETLDRSPSSYGSIANKYGFCIDKSSIVQHDFHRYSYVFDYMNASADGLERISVPSGHYVRTLHKGPYDDAGKTLALLIDHMDSHNYKIIGNAYIIPLIDLWASKSEDDYVSEILIRVEI